MDAHQHAAPTVLLLVTYWGCATIEDYSHIASRGSVPKRQDFCSSITFPPRNFHRGFSPYTGIHSADQLRGWKCSHSKTVLLPYSLYHRKACFYPLAFSLSHLHHVEHCDLCSSCASPEGMLLAQANSLFLLLGAPEGGRAGGEKSWCEGRWQ